MATDEITTDALDRLHRTINERRKASATVKVEVADLKALLYSFQRLLARTTVTIR